MKKLLFTLVACVAFIISASAQSVLVMPGDYPDPSIIKDGDDYYLTHTPNYYKPGFLIWHSKDLVSWEPVGHALTDWKGSAWAPDFQKVGDTYYIYYPDSGSNWVIWSKDVAGPWSEPIDLKIGGIDPGLVVTPEGKRYLFTNVGNVTPLTDDGLARAGETKHVYGGWDYPDEWDTECGCLESPKLTYHNGYYYMTSAQGGTAGPATSHMAVCARSKDIYGPWENSPYNPIVHTYSASEEWWSKGHGTLIEGPGGQWWIMYHAYKKDAHAIGRHTVMEPIEWTKGGWYRTIKDLDVTHLKPMTIDISDNFESAKIGWQWAGWKEPITNIVSTKKGAAIVPATGTTPKDGRMMIAAAPDYKYMVETSLTLDKGNQAGLMLFYRPNAFVGVTCSKDVITIHKSAASKDEILNKFGESLRLRLENKGKTLTMSASKDGKEWVVIYENLDIANMHHNKLGDFISLRPALCSIGEGETQFHEFIYKPIKE